MKQKRIPQANIAAIQAGLGIVNHHPIFSFINSFASIIYGENFPQGGFARILVKSSLSIELNPRHYATAGEWAYAIAQCHLHIALNHLDPVRSDEPWRFACELIAVDC